MPFQHPKACGQPKAPVYQRQIILKGGKKRNPSGARGARSVGGISECWVIKEQKNKCCGCGTSFHLCFNVRQSFFFFQRRESGKPDEWCCCSWATRKCPDKASDHSHAVLTLCTLITSIEVSLILSRMMDVCTCTVLILLEDYSSKTPFLTSTTLCLFSLWVVA